MLQLNKRASEPQPDDHPQRDDRVTSLHRGDSAFQLRSISLSDEPSAGPADFNGAFEIVTKAAEAMERAERQARGFRVNAIKHLEKFDAELAQAKAEATDLRAQLAEREAALQDAELRVRAATLRAKDSEARLEDLRRQLMAIEGELAGSRKWLAYFETHLADRFKNAARALGEMADASFEGDSIR